MWLLYLDESGNPDGDQDKYFVLAGLAVFERQAYWINEAVDKLAVNHFGSAEVEFHAQPIAAHREEPWRSLPTEQRNQIIDELAHIISESKAVLFAVALERAITSEPVSRAFEEICRRFDLYLKRLHFQNDTQRGLMVLDKTRYEARLQTLLSQYRSGDGTRFGRVQNFADVPLFADSRATRLLQLADLVAYSVFRRYERGDTRLIDKIVSKFDSENEVMHGLVHLALNQATCTCPACLTRRLASSR